MVIMMATLSVLLLSILPVVRLSGQSKFDKDIADDVDGAYWEMVNGFSKSGTQESTHAWLFENLFSCDLCHKIVDYARPLLLKKIPEERLRDSLRKSFCGKTIQKIKDYDKDLDPKVKLDLKKKICHRIVTENIVDIFTTIAVSDNKDAEKDTLYICEQTYPALCQKWMRGTVTKDEKVKEGNVMEKDL